MPGSFSLEKTLWMGREKWPDWLRRARLFLELKEGLDLILRSLI